MTIAGKIAESVYWYAGLTEWLKLNPLSPPQVPPNTVLYLGFFWYNTGDVQVRGHVDATLNKPDGTQVPLVLMSGHQDQVVNPGVVVGLMVGFEDVTLDKAGTYSVSIVLSMEAVGEVTPSWVSVTLRPRNAPANAAYWAVTFPNLVIGYMSIYTPMTLSSIPSSDPQKWMIIGCVDANYQRISTPNAFSAVSFSRPFENGKTYYWDFATGKLLDENLQAM